MPTYLPSCTWTDELSWDRAHYATDSSEEPVRAIPGLLRRTARRGREPKPAGSGGGRSPLLPELPPPPPEDSPITYACVRLDSRGRVTLGGFISPGRCAANPCHGPRPQLIVARTGTGHRIDSRGRLTIPSAFRGLYHWRPGDVLFVAADSSAKSVTLTAARDVFGVMP